VTRVSCRSVTHAPARHSAHADDDEPRSPTTATWLADGTTLAGLGLIVGAFAAFDSNGAHSFQHDRATWLLGTSGAALAIVGPSAGHIYAGESGHAALFSAGRFATLAIGTFSMGLASFCTVDSVDGTSHPSTADCGLALGLGLAGLIGYGALTYHDLRDAPEAARRYDRAHTDVQVVPLMMRDSAAHESLGLGIVGTF
jgi:hypothetical protein